MENKMNYQVGDTIEYAIGDGKTRRVYVQSKSANIKNGHRGFTGVLVDVGQFDAEPDSFLKVWGFDYQIIGVILTDSYRQT